MAIPISNALRGGRMGLGRNAFTLRIDAFFPYTCEREGVLLYCRLFGRSESGIG